MATDEFVYFEAEDEYWKVDCRTRSHLVRMSLKSLQRNLDPDAFWRASLGVIVPVAAIARAEEQFPARYALELRDRAETLRVSAAQPERFRRI